MYFIYISIWLLRVPIYGREWNHQFRVTSDTSSASDGKRHMVGSTKDIPGIGAEWNNEFYSLKKTTKLLSLYNMFRQKQGQGPHIFQTSASFWTLRALCSADSFHVLDHACTGFLLKIKEVIHIHREQPSLNQQFYHVNLKLSCWFSHFHALPLSFCPQLL